MNLRQKAKKYKQIAEINKAKAEAFDSIAVKRHLNSRFGMGYGTIETLTIVKLWDDRCSEDFVKAEIAKDIAECLLREGYISFEVDDDCDHYTGLRKVRAFLLIAKRRRCDEL